LYNGIALSIVEKFTWSARIKLVSAPECAERCISSSGLYFAITASRPAGWNTVSFIRSRKLFTLHPAGASGPIPNTVAAATVAIIAIACDVIFSATILAAIWMAGKTGDDCRDL
jgi:hypothetical protein